MTPALILIVDNSPETRNMYGDYFRFHGYSVAEAASGPEGAALTAELHPDLIVTELSPDSAWTEALWAMRAGSRGEPTPIIACSTSIEEAWPCAPACVDVALAKPTSPRDLLEQARQLLGRGALTLVAG
jgi:two-component system, OmpR family, response regulator